MKQIFVLILIITFAACFAAEEQTLDFRLENINGKYQKLSELQQDGLVIIDFWATWCDPCLNALPKMNELHQKYDDVTVIAVNLDKPRDKSKAVAHIKSNRFDFVTLFDPTSNVAKQFNVTGIPRTLIIDPQGEIIYDHTGYQRGDEKHYEAAIIQWQKTACESKQKDEKIEK